MLMALSKEPAQPIAEPETALEELPMKELAALLARVADERPQHVQRAPPVVLALLPQPVQREREPAGNSAMAAALARAMQRK